MSVHKVWSDFYGSSDATLLQPSTDGWLPVAREIREKLGDKAYLLDNYLAYAFAGLYHVTPGDAASDGDQASTVLWNAIRYAMEGMRRAAAAIRSMSRQRNTLRPTRCRTRRS